MFYLFQDQERFFFSMTYARNGDLLKFIDQMAERDIDCVQFYAAELLAAVEFLHFKVSIAFRMQGFSNRYPEKEQLCTGIYLPILC